MNRIKIDALNSPAMVFFDWILALSATAYGIYLFTTGSVTWVAYATLIGGLIGCVFAFLRPANLIKKNLRSKLVKR